MEQLTARDYRVMAWRNGGGQTTEIAIGSGETLLDRNRARKAYDLAFGKAEQNARLALVEVDCL